jgi:hypothetical protein
MEEFLGHPEVILILADISTRPCTRFLIYPPIGVFMCEGRYNPSQNTGF